MNQAHRAHPIMVLEHLSRFLYLLLLPLLRGVAAGLRNGLAGWLAGAWFDLLVLLLIVGSWVSGTIAGRHENADGGFMNFLFTASANFDIVFAAASIFMFSSIIGFIGFYFSVDSPRPCFLLLLSFIPLILSSRTMRELPVYFMLIMTGCFIFASANLSVPCFPGVKNFEGKHTRLRRAMLSCAASLLMTLAADWRLQHQRGAFAELRDTFLSEHGK